MELSFEFCITLSVTFLSCTRRVSSLYPVFLLPYSPLSSYSINQHISKISLSSCISFASPSTSSPTPLHPQTHLHFLASFSGTIPAHIPFRSLNPPSQHPRTFWFGFNATRFTFRLLFLARMFSLPNILASEKSNHENVLIRAGTIVSPRS